MSQKARLLAQDIPELPPVRKCGTMAIHFRQLEQDEDFRSNLIALEQLTNRRLATADAARRRPTTIPVVVHVIHRLPEENISDAQIHSQIRVLNEDFNATNSDRTNTPTVWQGLITSANISFKLASIDPDGKPTTGITRTQTQRTTFGSNDTVKYSATGGNDAWPTDIYLNIWVCSLGDQLLGYAQFPGGPADTDGVVILNKAFGTEGTAQAPFDKGRTATHEVGHYLNLRHIWGDDPQCKGSDLVDDTPNQQTANSGSPVFPHVSCSNGPNGDMFMNYMDYVDDGAMCMFTSGQVARMQAALDGLRSDLGTHGR